MLEAVLLLGPTGVGKSPLGDHLERVGWRGRRCHHFDFGAHLRAVQEGALRPAGLSDADIAVVRRALETGALLEDAEFPIAEAILLDFLERCGAAAEDLVLLNGLPRHVGQAEDVETLLSVVEVLVLHAQPATLLTRIRHDMGGDRAGRVDDEIQAVLRRVDRFRRRTRPLLERYAGRVRIASVGMSTQPGQVVEALERA